MTHDATLPTAAGDARLAGLQRWLSDELGLAVSALAPASSDASFRRYFRVIHPGGSHVVMDAPPPQEDCRPFLSVAALLRGLGLNAPQILASDLKQGYLLLDDLGDRRYLEALDQDNADALYGDAMDALERMQSGAREAALPLYDRELLSAEMDLFSDWLLGRHLGLELEPSERQGLKRSFDFLAESALSQPQVGVHRDYHSRNLMVMERNNPGILDFQDAMLGPVTYDLVSLLRDCYIEWPRQRVERWALDYLERPGVRALVGQVDADTWLRWFDLMGVQRHLKAAGIFARLWHRDGKSGYLADIPRTLGYIVQVGDRYPELAPLDALLRERVLPCVR